MKRFDFIIYLIAAAILFAACNRRETDPLAMMKGLQYLKELPEVSWVVYDGNDVFIGLKYLPDDVDIITNAAAVHASKAYGGRVEVWSISDRYREWRPWRPHNPDGTKNDGKYYCRAAADMGVLGERQCL